MSVIVDKAVERAVDAALDGILEQIGFFMEYDRNIDCLREKLDDLRGAKEKVDQLVKLAQGRLEEIHRVVLTWTSRAEEAIGDAERILAEDAKAEENKSCCCGLPNFENRYLSSKRAKSEAPALAELAREGTEFREVGYRAPWQQMLRNDDYEAIGSRESTLGSIMDALRNRDSDLIGVWGLGGVGKTTLAKEVGQRMKEGGVFQLVILAGVQPKPEVELRGADPLSKLVSWHKTIQEKIAEWVQIKKDVESLDSVELRAALLHKRLLQEKSVMVILDDVWDPIDLKKVGIPIGGDTNRRCMVLVTTRDEAVVSTMADMAKQEQKLFRLNVLKDDEAWELFQKKVGEIREDDPVHRVATQVVKKCGGLPVLVLPVAAALKNKELHVWDDALLRLQSGLQKNGDDMQALAYSALELSYSHLAADHMSLFLFCGLLKPRSIDIGDMVKYTTGLRLFKDCSTVKATRSRVLKLLGDLESSCLLLKGDNHEHFTMHDVVHSFARGYKDHVFSPVDYSVVDEWPDMQVLEQLTHISLRRCQLPDLPTRLECPNLKVFLFYGPPSTPDDMFFDAAEELKVLDLSDVRLSPLPPSLQRLQSLQTLCLDRCVVEDVAAVGNLTQLKILSLIGADIVHLPKEIGKLVRLQLLDLNKCMELKRISPGVLSCLTNLEELYMRDSFTQWGSRDKTSGQQINAGLGELKKLKKLTTLEIGVTDMKSLPDDLFSNKLERFFIVIGDCWDWSRKKDVSRTLKLKLDASIRVLKKVRVLLNKTDDLHLDNSVGVKGVNLFESNMEVSHHLRNLQLLNFHEVQYLVNSVERGPYTAFPELESLVIENARHLEKICNGSLAEKSLRNLKQIKIANCDELRNVFPLSVAKCLSKLEDINVTYCKEIEGIFVVDQAAEEDDEQIHLTDLRKLTLEHVPRLGYILSTKDASALNSQDVEVDGGPPLHVTFFDQKIVFPNIKDLKLCSINTLKIWNSEFQDSYSSIKILSTLIIEGCKNIRNIFDASMVDSLVELKTLKIRNCKLVRKVIIPDEHGKANKKICFPKLESLVLKQLHLLGTVCSGDMIECPKLKVLWIDDCPRLKTFITSPSSNHQPSKSFFDNKVLFPNLETLRISNMHRLRMVWHEELHEDSFRKLKIFRVDEARHLSKLFSSIMLGKVHTLEILILDNCGSLKEVFDLRGLISEKGEHRERIAALKKIQVRRLPKLKHVWRGNPQGILSFQDLRSVVFNDCSSLESLIPASVAQQLPQLEEIILNGGSAKQIISMEGEYQDVDAIFEFPSLKRIQLWTAQRLSSFYPGKHILDLPALQHVSILACPRLEVFKSELGNGSSPSQPMFSFEEVVSKLESVSLSSQETKTILKTELPDVLSSKLKVVDLHGFGDDSVVLPVNLLERFPYLEELLVSYSDFKELFTHDILNDQNGIRALSRISRLRVECLPALKQIWNQQSELDIILKNLNYLKVRNCKSLTYLVPPSTSLTSLTTLTVENCQSLASMFTLSTMKSLVQLREMTVSGCDMLTEIVAVADGEIENEAEISLHKLEILKLCNLESITSFCSQNNVTLKFPLLVELIVEKCPEIEFFSLGYLSTPKLKTVRLTQIKDNSRWKGDLNTTIRQLHFERGLTSEEEDEEEEEEEEDLGDLFLDLLDDVSQLLGGEDLGLGDLFSKLLEEDDIGDFFSSLLEEEEDDEEEEEKEQEEDDREEEDEDEDEEDQEEKQEEDDREEKEEGGEDQEEEQEQDDREEEEAQ